MLFSITTGRRGQGRRAPEVRSAQIRKMKTLSGLKTERLEDRIALAISTWSGAVNDLWSNPGNWDTLPNPGDTLVFPAGASVTIPENDFPAGTVYESIAINADDYVLDGNAIGISSGVTATYPTGDVAILFLDVNFNGPFPGISVSSPGSRLDVRGSISTSASELTKGGAGVLAFGKAQTYTADTIVNNGAIWVDFPIASSVKLNPTTELAGDGALAALTSTGGIVQPGKAGIGILEVNSLSLDSDSNYIISLFGPSASGYGRIASTGAVNLGSADLTVNLNYTPVGADEFRIIDNLGSSPINGTFAGLPEGSTIMLGSAPFKISYVGGDGNDVTLTHQIVTTTSLTSTVNPTVYGQSLTLVAGVGTPPGTGTPTGSVQFFSGATLLSTVPIDVTGTATFVTSALEVGTNALTAVYLGAGNYLTSTSPVLQQVVDQAETTVTLVGAPNPSQIGQSVKFTATVQAKNPGSGVPTGTVNFFAGAVQIGSGTLDGTGKAELTTTGLPLGTSQITARYLGDSRYVNSVSTEFPQVVNKITTTSTVTSSANPANPGVNVTFTATVAAGQGFPTPTGSVNFMNGTTVLATVPLDAQGKATFASSTLPIGTNAITVSYAGVGDFGASTSSVLSQVINKVATTTTLTTAPNPSNFGGGVILTATVTPNLTGYPAPTGTVQFLNGTTVLGTGTLGADGKATLTVATFAVGTQSLTATYQGDTNNATSTSTAVSQVVNKANSTVTLTPSTNYVTAGGMVTFTAKVTPSTSGVTTVPTGQVRFVVNGVTFAIKSLTNGEATYSASGFQLGLGVDSIKAEYVGDTNFAAATSPDVTVVAGTDDERWLNQVFLQVMFKPIDYQSLVKWDDRLQRGSSRACVVTKIRNTPLGRQMLVQQSFNEYLGRDGTEDEIRMVQGAAQRTRTSPRAIVLGTPEFYNDIGDGTPEGYVTALETVLGTTFSPRASAMIVHQLNAGEPPFKVAEHVLTSRTGRRALIEQMFQQVLGRDATDRELAAFSWQETRGVYWRQQQSYLLASKEFYEMAIAEPGFVAE